MVRSEQMGTRFDARAMASRALVTPEAMGRADARTIESGVPQRTLVARAARACFRIIRSRYPRQLVTILCGPGHNGEDGFVLGTLLAEAGWPVDVMRLDGEQPLDEERFGSLISKLRPTGVFAPDRGMIVVDALFGAGLSRPLEGEARTLVERLEGSGATVVAIDLPSGIDGTTGEVLGAAAQADATITFHRLKPGHLLGAGAERCGRVYLADIGVQHDSGDTAAFWNDPVLWQQLLGAPERDTHKYARGHVAVIGGPGLRGGAGRLAARAASVSGAGAVTHFSPASAAEFAAAHFDAVMVRQVGDPEMLADALGDRVGSVVMGPGMGHGEAAAARLDAVLRTRLPAVLDADALTLHEDMPQAFYDQLHAGCVLTPHEGEFRRLFPGLQGDKLTRAEAAARRCGATVLLKGATTVIATPGAVPVLTTNGSPALATAGSGDCLAGVIGGLLARGIGPHEAAAMGAWIHAEAGRDAAPSLTAEELPARIAGVFAALLRPGLDKPHGPI